jgi:saccharopine dehydrogenase-like NADP-dependent oxidoreductase
METKENIQNKKILILGSGMMVEPLIDYLLKNPNNFIHIGTNLISSANAIIKKMNKKNILAEELDVTQDEGRLKKLIQQSDLVISYVPPILHEIVANACLSEKRNMITTSYISQSMEKLNEKVKDAGLIFMNEIGLDPGIDHLITHKVIHDAKQNGEKIIHYESWCGALCSPEFINNPLLYKFSWAPRGALLALNNEVKQWINGKFFSLASNDSLTQIVNKQFHPCFNFEGYYNRDSITYKDLYNLKDADTVIRGTIRYKGFTFVFQCFKNLGLFEENKFDQGIDTWKKFFLVSKLKNSDLIFKNMEKKFLQNYDGLLISDKNSEKENYNSENDFYYKLSLLALSKFDDDYIKSNGFSNLFNRIFPCLKYLGLYDDNSKVYNFYFYFLDRI